MERIFCLIDRLREQFGSYIGTKSIRKLCVFIAGYECAIMELTGSRIRFDALFQNYIENISGILNSEKHWDELLQRDSSDEVAFDIFYRHFENFKNHYNDSDLNVFLVAPRCYSNARNAVYELVYITPGGANEFIGCFESKTSARRALVAKRKEPIYQDNPSAFLIIQNT